MQLDSVLFELMRLETPHTATAHYTAARRAKTSDRAAAQAAADFPKCLEYAEQLRAEIAELRERIEIAEAMIADTRILGFERQRLEHPMQQITISDSETIGRGFFWATSKPLQDSNY